MALQELDHRINQVCEKYCEYKDQEDSSRTVNSCAYHAKEKRGQQNVEGTALRECHFPCPHCRSLRGALSHTRYAPPQIDACNARATLAGEVEGAVACDNRCWIAEELWDIGAYSVSP